MLNSLRSIFTVTALLSSGHFLVSDSLACGCEIVYDVELQETVVAEACGRHSHYRSPS